MKIESIEQAIAILVTGIENKLVDPEKDKTLPLAEQFLSVVKDAKKKAFRKRLRLRFYRLFLYKKEFVKEINSELKKVGKACRYLLRHKKEVSKHIEENAWWFYFSGQSVGKPTWNVHWYSSGDKQKGVDPYAGCTVDMFDVSMEEAMKMIAASNFFKELETKRNRPREEKFNGAFVPCELSDNKTETTNYESIVSTEESITGNNRTTKFLDSNGVVIRELTTYLDHRGEVKKEVSRSAFGNYLKKTTGRRQVESDEYCYGYGEPLLAHGTEETEISKSKEKKE